MKWTNSMNMHLPLCGRVLAHTFVTGTSRGQAGLCLKNRTGQRAACQQPVRSKEKQNQDHGSGVFPWYCLGSQSRSPQPEEGSLRRESSRCLPVFPTPYPKATPGRLLQSQMERALQQARGIQLWNGWHLPLYVPLRQPALWCTWS